MRIHLVFVIIFGELFAWGMAMPVWAEIFSGQVVDALTQERLPGAQILDDKNQSVTTDKKGNFQLALENPQVRIRMPGYNEKRASLIAGVNVIGLDTSNVYELKAVMVKAKPDAKKVVVSKQQIKKEAVKKVTTTLFPDVAKVLQMLPGVTSNGDMSALLYVRGGDPDEVLASLDDMVILQPYIWGGNVSIFNPNLVDTVEFYTGGFSAEWPQAMSAVLDVKNKVGNTEKFQGFADLSAATFDFFLDGPLDRSAGSSFLFGLRRTHYDLIIKLFSRDDMIYPYFYDGQAKLSFPDKNGVLTINTIYSIEGMEFLIKNEEGEDSKDINFHYLDRKLNFSASYDYHYSDEISCLTLLGLYYQDGSYKMIDALNPFDVKESQATTQLRHNWTFLLGEHQILKSGLFLFPSWGKASVAYTTKIPTMTGFYEKDVSLERTYNHIYYSGWFIQDDIEVLNDFLYLNPGVNVQYWSENKQWISDPRISLKIKITPDWETYFATGKYSQFPLDTSELDRETGNPNLTAKFAYHYILGTKLDMGDDYFIQLETYYKDYQNMIGNDPIWNYDNNSLGHAYGYDIILQKKSGGQWDGWITYSYVQSKRKLQNRNSAVDGQPESIVPVDTWYTAGNERPHSINLILNYTFNERYKLAFTQKYSTGKVFTPIVSADYNAYIEEYIPKSGEFNSERMPDYVSTDIKFSMPFFNLKGWSAYIQISNLLDHKNVNSYRYVYKKEGTEVSVKQEPVYDLPRIFFGGVKYEF